MSAIYLRIFIIISRHQKGRRLNYERSTVSRGALSAAGPVGTAASVNLPQLMVKTDKVITTCATCAARSLQGDDEEDPTILILSDEIEGTQTNKSHQAKVKGIYCATKSIENCLDDGNKSYEEGTTVDDDDDDNGGDDDYDGDVDGEKDKRKGYFRDKTIKKDTTNQRLTSISPNYKTDTSMSTIPSHAMITNSETTPKRFHGEYYTTEDPLKHTNEFSKDVESNSNNTVSPKTIYRDPLEQKNHLGQTKQQNQQSPTSASVEHNVGGESSLGKQDHSLSQSNAKELKHVSCPKTTTFASSLLPHNNVVEFPPPASGSSDTIHNNTLKQQEQQISEIIKQASTQLTSDLGIRSGAGPEEGAISSSSNAESQSAAAAAAAATTITTETKNPICDNKLRHFSSKSTSLLLRSNTIGSKDRSSHIATTFQSSVGSRPTKQSYTSRTLSNKEVGRAGGVGIGHKAAESGGVRMGTESVPLITKPTSGRPDSLNDNCSQCGGKTLVTLSNSQRSSISSSAVATSTTSQIYRASKVRRSPTSFSTSGQRVVAGGGCNQQQQEPKFTVTTTTYAANSSFIVHKDSNNGSNNNAIGNSSNNGTAYSNSNLGQNYVPASPTSTYEPQRRHIHASAVPQTNTKALVTTLLILGTYFISYVPAIIYQVLTCIDNCPYPLYTISFSRRVLLGAMTTLLLIAKSIIDPFIYSYRMSEIQIAINKYLSKRRSKSSLAASTHQTSQRLNTHNLSLYNSHHHSHLHQHQHQHHHNHHQHYHNTNNSNSNQNINNQSLKQSQQQRQQNNLDNNNQHNNTSSKFKFNNQITQANSSPKILTRDGSISRSIIA